MDASPTQILDTVATIIVWFAVPLGIAVEAFELSPRLFGEPVGDDSSASGMVWRAMAAVILFKVASWLLEVIVPRDPTIVVAGLVWLMMIAVAARLAFHASREVIPLARKLREMRSG